jgi:hypothetical protein
MRGLAVVILAVLAIAAPTHAQDTRQGVSVYPAAFFAAARANTAFDMIARLPGFTFDPGAPQLRGFAGAAGNVLIDGQRPTTKQDDLQSILTRIPAAQVERIEIIRGGTPGIDMQGRTVLANVVRRRTGGLIGALTLAEASVIGDGRQVPTLSLEAANQANGRSLEGSINLTRYIADDVGPGPHATRDAAGAAVYRARLAAQGDGIKATLTGAAEMPLAGGRFRLNALAFDDHYLDREADHATLGADDSLRDQIITDRGEIGAHYARDLGPRLKLEMLALQQVQRKAEQARFAAPGNDQRFAVTNLLAESIARATVRYQHSPNVAFETAIEGAYNVQDTASALTLNGAPQPLPAANIRAREWRGEVAASATWTPSARLTLEAGARFEASTIRVTGDVVQQATLTYPKPRIVLTLSPDAQNQLRLRLEREVGQLDFTSFAASGSLSAGGVHAGNPNLVPQGAWVAEAAFERRFGEGADVTLTLRHLAINSAIDRIAVYDPNPPPAGTYFDEPGNIGRATENDLAVDATLPLDAVGVRGGLLKLTATARTTSVTDPTTRSRRPLTQVHPLDGEAHFSQDLARLKATWGVDAFAAYRETYYRFNEIDLIQAGVYLTIFYEYKPSSGLSLRAEFTDLAAPGVARTLNLYSGPRGAGVGPSLIDYRAERHGPTVLFRVRRGFR